MRRLLVPLSVLLLASGCGVTLSDAREGTARRLCAWNDRCGNVGAGKSYATLEECVTKERANMIDALPTADCEGRINGQNVDVCWKAIEITACNFLDYLATLSKCDKGDLCVAK